MVSDSSELVTVSSSDHHDALVNRLWDLFTSQRGTDFHVHVGGQSIRAHQLILELFLSPHKLGICALKDRPHCLNLDVLLEFLYKGSVTVKREQLQSLLQAANDLDFKMLVSAVESASIDNTGGGGGGGRSSRRRRKGKPVKRLNDNPDDVQYDDPITPDDSNPASPDQTGSSNLADDWLPAAKKTAPRSKIRMPAGAKGHRDNLGQTSPRKRPNRLSKRRVKVQPTSPAPLGDGDSLESDDARDGGTDDLAPTDAQSICLPDTRPIIKCSECSYFTRSESRHQLHLARRHDPSLTNRLPCSRCHKSFTNAALLADHMFLHTKKPRTPIPRQLNCADCSYKSPFPFKLRLHRDAVHSNIKSFECDRCDYRAAIKSNLARHVKVAHLKIRPFVCEMCASTFPTLSHLAKHHRMHTGEKPYVCSVDSCRKAYASQYAFKAHVRRHQGLDDKAFVCDVCGFACNRNDNLRAHLRNVHGRRPGNTSEL